MADQRINKWTRWIDGRMKDDILGMHLRRETWQQVQSMLQAHGDLPDSYWWRFMFDTYAEAQGAAVRRQVYADKDADSLGRLLHEISQDARLMTRSFWLDLRADHDDAIDAVVAEAEWNDEFAGDVGDHLDG